ncbi:MAG: nucleotidyltransferase [Chitinophagaceae bacterium]|nr:nucleotidyltransferase [Chitinophagaceae bacterium]MDP1763286.1 nucleotidyltransferase [Sediminibacterium sp.]
MILAKDFEDFIRLLNSHQVEYMIVGGYALGFHGAPRYTGDIDIWINISETNADKMVQVITDFGFASLGFERADFLKQGYISQIGQPPLRIDILNSIDGVDFNQAVKNRQVVDIDGIPVFYVGFHDFIKNKESVGRLKDRSDIEEIKKATGRGDC